MRSATLANVWTIRRQGNPCPADLSGTSTSYSQLRPSWSSCADGRPLASPRRLRPIAAAVAAAPGLGQQSARLPRAAQGPTSQRLLAPLCACVALLLGAAGPTVNPAAARIPTEAVMSESSGGGGGFMMSERSALRQLAAPPSAVINPAGAGTGSGGAAEVWLGEPGGAQPGSASSTSASREALIPGTMVGTPNYARGAAGRSASAAAPRSTASEAVEALGLLASAREAVDGGQHEQALNLYVKLVTEHPDLALAEYGRIGRAMLLYQTGRTSDSILALEDEEVSMRGAAEVHAALAALLYTERPSLTLRAEEEWTIACSFDKRYSDTEWVRANKHWPPRMISALQKFLSLT